MDAIGIGIALVCALVAGGGIVWVWRPAPPPAMTLLPSATKTFCTVRDVQYLDGTRKKQHSRCRGDENLDLLLTPDTIIIRESGHWI